ncbi:hypothetical protein SEA_MORRILL_48 [Microbacterium phage Morrill]|nr:hypothetical protein SEA_ATRAXI_48 [Microbacterium phage Atraxi]UQT01733.1 hypothetical protein SEA_MORRILL_48 [Microbacterium phage Morrill]
MDFQRYAREKVSELFNVAYLEPEDKMTTPDDFYVVWSCKTLQNWKCLVSTDITDGVYYELTHNGDKNETYVDEYHKARNVVVSYVPPAS